LSRVVLALAGALYAVSGVAAAQWGSPDADARRAAATAGLDRPEGALSPMASAEALAVLKRTIDRYRRIEAQGGWRPIPKGPPLRSGDNEERVELLRRRLEAEGEVIKGGFGFGFASAFDANLEEALKKFQLRHGLRPSGVLNGETLTMLNIPVGVRIVQLTRSADRMAELLPQMQPGRRIVVNIPSFELQVVSGREVELYSRVVVGKPATATPSVHSTVRAVDLMPYWHVPQVWPSARSSRPCARTRPIWRASAFACFRPGAAPRSIPRR
jgi:murein L,D-transpeptidase YcbB/YkuD